ncbi:MAG: electron transfer flavoprotein subunit alpha/FixB family protein [Longimicrobiales bacterium]
MSGVLAVAEVKDGVLRGVSAEVVSTARRVADASGGEVHVVACGGPGTGDVLAGAGEWGADAVFAVESPELAAYHGPAYATQLSRFIEARASDVVLVGATAQGRDLAPRIGARLKRPVLTDVTAVEVVDGALHVTRPVYAGKALAQFRVEGSGGLVASIRPNVFPKEAASRSPAAEVVPVASDTTSARYRVKSFEPAPGAALDVSEASVIVSGGRGMKGPEHWGLLEDLRDALGDSAALGASRAVVDAGWRPHGEQVGQTGKTVAPKLYFAVGISGAIQHLAGMKTSQVIVAVNKDPDAPIFGVADYGIVGDAFEVVPELAAQIRTLRSGG